MIEIKYLAQSWEHWLMQVIPAPASTIFQAQIQTQSLTLFALIITLKINRYK